MTLDYKKPEGKALFLRLVEGTGVLVENYRPTVLPRAGLGFADLREVNPRLIYAQLSGLGYDGPYAGRGGFDLIAQGMGGIMHVTGEPDGPPTSVGLPICDLGTGMWAVQGILAALLRTPAHRQRPPRRMLAIGDPDRLQLVDLGAMARRPRGADPARLAPSPECALPAHADQGWLSDGGGRRRGDLGALCKGFGVPRWCEDPRFATNRARMANREALEAVMNAVLTTQTTTDWVEVLEAAAVPCGPVYDYAAAVRRPAGAPPRSRAIREGRRTGRGAAHPHAHQDRRRGAGARRRPEARPAQRRGVWPPWSQRSGTRPTARLRRIVIAPARSRASNRRPKRAPKTAGLSESARRRGSMVMQPPIKPEEAAHWPPPTLTIPRSEEVLVATFGVRPEAVDITNMGLILVLSPSCRRASGLLRASEVFA